MVWVNLVTLDYSLSCNSLFRQKLLSKEFSSKTVFDYNILHAFHVQKQFCHGKGKLQQFIIPLKF